MTRRNRPHEAVTTPISPRYISTGCYTLFAILSYLFWAFPYRGALSYREQLQLFQTTPAYFNTLARRPGGVATYAGEFLTQFFNNYWIGSAVMTALLTLFLLLSHLVAKRFAPHAPKATTLLLATIPPVALWLSLGNPDMLATFITALTMVIAGVRLFTATDHGHTAIESYAPMLAGTVLLYWLAGPATVVFTSLAVAFIIIRKRVAPIRKIIFALIAPAWLGVNILMWAPVLPFPVSYQLIGIGYMLTPDTLTLGEVVTGALCVATPVLAAVSSRIPKKIMIPCIAIAGTAAIAVIYPVAYDKTTYRLIDYDYLVRANDWDAILRYSDRHEPDLPLSVSATNLALGMTGQLDSRPFDYFQHGAEGLVPPFTKETLSSWTTGEIFFQLGMTNSSQRFYFEGMEAIPNYNKSCRAIRRLAETAIIRGDYKVAEKYLNMLDNTLFYSNWARRNLRLIKDPEGVEGHPLYGRLRARMVDEEYMFSEGELDKTLGQLFLKDPGNSLARQYLILYPLLQRDLNRFSQYMGVVAEAYPQYNPPLAQQAMAFMAMKNGRPVPKGAVKPAIEQSLRDFAVAWTSKDPSRLQNYRHTLYHYLLSNQ